jgi:hypothetical protein
MREFGIPTWAIRIHVILQFARNVYLFALHHITAGEELHLPHRHPDLFTHWGLRQRGRPRLHAIACRRCGSSMPMAQVRASTPEMRAACRETSTKT